MYVWCSCVDSKYVVLNAARHYCCYRTHGIDLPDQLGCRLWWGTVCSNGRKSALAHVSATFLHVLLWVASMQQWQYLYSLSVTWSWVHSSKCLAMVDSISHWVGSDVWLGIRLRGHITARYTHSNCVFSNSTFSFQKRSHWLCSATDTSPFNTAMALLTRLSLFLSKNGGISGEYLLFWALFSRRLHVSTHALTNQIAATPTPPQCVPPTAFKLAPKQLLHNSC